MMAQLEGSVVGGEQEWFERQCGRGMKQYHDSTRKLLAVTAVNMLWLYD
jgi:hypothetical protein